MDEPCCVYPCNHISSYLSLMQQLDHSGLAIELQVRTVDRSGLAIELQDVL